MELSQEWLNQNIWWVALVALWDLAWKGWALWIAARQGNKPWFIALLIISSSGLLPILYIFIFSKDAKKPHKE